MASSQRAPHACIFPLRVVTAMTKPTSRWALRFRRLFASSCFTEKGTGGGKPPVVRINESRPGAKPVARRSSRNEHLPCLHRRFPQVPARGSALSACRHRLARCHPGEASIDGADLGGRLVIGVRSPRPRCHPRSRSSHGLVTTFRLGSPSHWGPAARLHAPVNISGLTRHRCRPDLHREQSSHGRWSPGLPSPRTAAHFAFVRPVELDEQTTSPSRTVPLSGASPDFPSPNPLSGRLLIAVYSVHFQEFQALQALAGSCSPHALTRTYTLLLSARRKTSGRDPQSSSAPVPDSSAGSNRLRVWPCRLRPSELAFCRPRAALPVYVGAFRRASVPFQGHR